MTKRILIYPYSMQSASAKLLKAALGAQFIKHSNSQYVPKYNDLVINWGSTYVPYYGPALQVNKISAVAKACNKLNTFIWCGASSVPCVPWTILPAKAKEWLKEGHKVVVRHSISSSGGKGIEILTPPVAALEAPPAAKFWASYYPTWLMLKPAVASNLAQETPIHVPTAPLYTRYVDKEAEFRVHVGGDKAIHTQMKLRKNGVEKKDVWNHDGGYTFTSQCEGRVDASILHSVREIGVRAVKALGLDFGAADIAYAGGSCYILEVNTAPGIEEPTLSKYVEYFRSI